MRLKGLVSVWATVCAQIDLKNATITVQDGSTAPNSIEIKIGEGNLTFSERRNMEYTLDRGILDEVREGDEVPMDVRMDFVWEYLLGSAATGAVATIEDALKKRGNASGWMSTDADPCRPYAVDIIITYVPDCTPGDTEVITLADFRYEQLDHDARAGTVACSGRCTVKEASSVRYPTT